VIELLLQAERLLVHGMVDEAEDMFRRIAEQDPRNAIAVVGLARVALERGDDRLAYEQACAALEIDRQNVAALRLEARLSEVFATRGEPVERPAWLGASGAHAERATRVTPTPLAAPSPVADHGRPSERFVLTHNPSMADHRQREAPPPAPVALPARAAERTPKARPGLLRRLLGR